MAAPALSVYLNPRNADLAIRLLRSASRNSEPLRLARFRPHLAMYYQDSRYLRSLDPYPGRIAKSRTRLPLYGFSGRTTPGVRVTVPAGTTFVYPNEQDLPYFLPSVSIRAVRSRRFYTRLGLPTPRVEIISGGPPSRFRPEANRRRKDQKIDYGYRRILSAINRTYGRYDEFAEFTDTYWQNAHDPAQLFTALALNEAVDVAYGNRARLLRENLYSRPEYKLPIGIDALNTVLSYGSARNN